MDARRCLIPGYTIPNLAYTRCHRDVMTQMQGQANKVVVAFLDGRRAKGYVFNFSALRDTFRLFPEQTSHHEAGTDIPLKDLKAIFFVKDFIGHPEYHESYDIVSSAHGRRVEVKCADGETIVAVTEGYNPQKPGFFVFPPDPNSNNLRIFVVTKNARSVRML